MKLPSEYRHRNYDPEERKETKVWRRRGQLMKVMGSIHLLEVSDVMSTVQWIQVTMWNIPERKQNNDNILVKVRV